MSTVINVAGYPVDLDDGRTLASGASDEVDTDRPHNRTLVVQGQLHVVEGMTPKKSQPARLVRDVARTHPEGEDR